jgi:hypothetical protein
LATELTSSVKNTPTSKIVPKAHEACPGWVPFVRHAKMAAQDAKISAHNRMEPSREDHRETMVKLSGVVVLPTSETYFTEKSWVMRAYSIRAVATAMPAKNM